MSGEGILTNLFLGVIIAGFLWWAFGTLNQPLTRQTDKPIFITITKDAFQPALIQVAAGQPIKLRFFRTTAQGCTSSVAFPQLRLAYQIPLNQSVEINLPPMQRGAWDFNCLQGKNRGKIVVS